MKLSGRQGQFIYITSFKQQGHTECLTSNIMEILKAQSIKGNL